MSDLLTSGLSDPVYVSQAPIKNAVTQASSALGELDKAATNAFFGLNCVNVGVPVKPNSDHYGVTLFVRPRLNLSYDNISGVRNMTSMLTDNQYTLPRVVRALLDPVSNKGLPINSQLTVQKLSTPIVDEKNAFIPILSNLLTGISGWPDSVMDTHTSPTGLANETWSMIDSLPMDYSTYDLTATFRNVSGDPISFLMHIWTQYAARVCEGSMMPWPDSIIENEMDYNTRIYRLVLDPTRRYVQKIAACGYAFPYVNPTAAAFNYDIQSPIAQDIAELSVPFKCNGAIYNDPILILEFNETVCDFNIDMKDSIRQDAMVKVPREILHLFNNRCYPRIETDGSMELTWWATNDYYIQICKKYGSIIPSKYIPSEL